MNSKIKMLIYNTLDFITIIMLFFGNIIIIGGIIIVIKNPFYKEQIKNFYEGTTLKIAALILIVLMVATSVLAPKSNVKTLLRRNK